MSPKRETTLVGLTLIILFGGHMFSTSEHERTSGPCTITLTIQKLADTRNGKIVGTLSRTVRSCHGETSSVTTLLTPPELLQRPVTPFGQGYKTTNGTKAMSYY